MINLAWKVKELSELNEQRRSLHSAMNVLTAQLAEECNWIGDNITIGNVISQTGSQLSLNLLQG